MVIREEKREAVIREEVTYLAMGIGMVLSHIFHSRGPMSLVVNLYLRKKEREREREKEK